MVTLSSVVFEAFDLGNDGPRVLAVVDLDDLVGDHILHICRQLFIALFLHNKQGIVLQFDVLESVRDALSLGQGHCLSQVQLRVNSAGLGVFHHLELDPRGLDPS